jgi:hypothetical protein
MAICRNITIALIALVEATAAISEQFRICHFVEAARHTGSVLAGEYLGSSPGKSRGHLATLSVALQVGEAAPLRAATGPTLSPLTDEDPVRN